MKQQEKCKCGAKGELFLIANEPTCENCIPKDLKQQYIRWNPKLAKEK